MELDFAVRNNKKNFQRQSFKDVLLSRVSNVYEIEPKFLHVRWKLSDEKIGIKKFQHVLDTEKRDNLDVLYCRLLIF